MIFKRLIFFALLLCAQITMATEETRVTEDVNSPGLFGMLTNLPDDWMIWADRVFSKENLPMLAGLTAGSVLLFVTDHESWQATKKLDEDSNFFHSMNKQGEFAGQGISQFLLAGTFTAVGVIGSDAKSLRTASQIIEAILGTSAIVQLGKHITGRESPFKITTHRTGKWDLFPDQIKYSRNVQAHDAVPSGHIATAMTTFIVIAENYPEQKWIPYLGYPAIAWVAASLVGTSIHWWSDIPFGIAIGYSMAKVVTRDNYKNGVTSNFHFTPMVTDNNEPLLGLAWSIE